MVSSFELIAIILFYELLHFLTPVKMNIVYTSDVTAGLFL